MGEYKELVSKLEKLFGRFDADHKRFENANNSFISRELGYSDAQFSRLINESATEGEYQRALQNVNRILTVQKLEAELGKSNKKTPYWKKNFWKGAALALLIPLTIFIILFFKASYSKDSILANTPKDYTLKWTFESSFINPYVKLDDLPSNCDYPCYKYQGKWQLQKSYKLPFFRERNGFHYVATEVEMYARCMVEKSEKGDIVEGYEYQKHEIWYDVREWPIDSFMVSGTTPSLFYQELNLDDQPEFIKVANVHTFFRNEFILGDSTIKRSGKVIGRDLEIMSREELAAKIKENEKLNDIEIQLNKLANNRLVDFSVPIKCQDSRLVKPNVEDVTDGDTMGFKCQLTTSGFPIDYVKTYVLKDQYIKNDCVQSSQ